MKILIKEISLDQSVEFKDIKSWYDVHLHPSVIDIDDQHVYEHIYHSGRWAGIFQFTARGAQQFCTKARPTNIIEIAAITSIYRPGPLVASVDKQFVEAKQHPDDVVYDHPLIKDVLGSTFGFLVFQEQMLKLGNVVGNMPLAKCDRLRKVITKRTAAAKDKAAIESEQLGKEFIAGAIENGFTLSRAEELWDNMAAFKGYAFNLSHALSYAIDSYMCAWLMTYYEPEWLCAYMETQANNPLKRAKALGELMAQGYEIVRVDINKATEKWTIIDTDAAGNPVKQFMPSFLTVKGLGEVAVNEIYLNRPYKTVGNLLWKEDASSGRVWRHSKFNKKAFENLIRIRAFDSMGIVGPGKIFASYKQMLTTLIGEFEWNAEKKKLVVSVDNMKDLKHKKKGFDKLQEQLEKYSTPEWSKEWTKEELLAMSKELVGSYDLDLLISTELRKALYSKRFHCIDELVKAKKDDGEDDVDDLDDVIDDGVVKAKGHWFIIEEITPRVSKSGKHFLLLNVFGEAGSVYRLYVWNWNPEWWEFAPLKKYKTFLAQDIETTEFGFSVKMKDMRPAVDRWLTEEQ